MKRAPLIVAMILALATTAFADDEAIFFGFVESYNPQTKQAIVKVQFSYPEEIYQERLSVRLHDDIEVKPNQFIDIHWVPGSTRVEYILYEAYKGQGTRSPFSM